MHAQDYYIDYEISEWFINNKQNMQIIYFGTIIKYCVYTPFEYSLTCKIRSLKFV